MPYSITFVHGIIDIQTYGKRERSFRDKYTSRFLFGDDRCPEYRRIQNEKHIGSGVHQDIHCFRP